MVNEFFSVSLNLAIVYSLIKKLNQQILFSLNLFPMSTLKSK